VRGAVEQADADGELMIGLAAALDPIVDPEKPEVSPRKIEPELSQQAFLNRANSICGIRSATATSRTPRALRPAAQRAPSARHRIVSSVRPTASVESSENSVISRRWSSRFNRRISLGQNRRRVSRSLPVKA
jgi:hypothetical protein